MTPDTDDNAAPPRPAPERKAWVTPVIERMGGIDDVEGGGNPGLDGNNLPARMS